MSDDTATVAVKFKRRKTAHPKRTRLGADDELSGTAQPPSDQVPAQSDTAQTLEDDDISVSLKEILRNRKRPRDRLREAAQRAELTKAQALALREEETPKQGIHASRFVAQTGQVVDRDDEQM